MSTELMIGIAVGTGVLLVAAIVVVAVILLRRRALPGADDAELPGPRERAEEGEGVRAPPAATGGTLLARLATGLSRTKGQLVQRLDALFSGGTLDDALLEQLEEILISADVGVRTTMKLIDGLRDRMRAGTITEPSEVRAYLREQMERILVGTQSSLATVDTGPLVLMVVGVNGSGKTTTIGKLASRYATEGRAVLLAAADTFRAAAIEQLEIWGERAGAEVIRRDEGADPASVVHDAITAARSRGADVVIADTAGRLHTARPLMDELQKVKRVMSKKLPGAPHETLLVIDANNGQNAIAQARSFAEAVDITGIVLTKLDGTAKGGVIIGICDELGIPVKLIGIGEQVEDLRDFSAREFIEALFDTEAVEDDDVA